MAGVWLVLWVIAAVWCGAVLSQSPSGNITSGWLGVAGLALLVVAVALLLACGYVLGRDRRWAFVWILIGYVWVLFVVLYVVAMLAATSSSGNDDDTAAGTGLVILGVPMLFLVGIFVGIGVGASLLAGRHRSPDVR